MFNNYYFIYTYTNMLYICNIYNIDKIKSLLKLI